MLQTPSPNFNDRKPYDESGVCDPCMLVMHYTGMKSAKDALERLCDPAAQVSAHYVVEEDGRVYELVDPSKRAWHAGVSYWRGITDVNSASIGIEIVNPGHEFGYRSFPQEQMDAVRDLSLDLIERYKIAARDVVAHSDIAPARKMDPGELFDWAWLAAKRIGAWPAPQQQDFEAAQKLLNDKVALREALVRYGYDPDCDLQAVQQAFMRRYDAGNFKGNTSPQQFSEKSAAMLCALLRVKLEFA